VCLSPVAARSPGEPEAAAVQGVIKMFDPLTNEGVLVSDADRSEVVLSSSALEGSIFRMLRQGQRVNFDLDDAGLATRLRSGAEPDLGLPTAQV
jgi:CspA family cold shock protein